MSNNSNIAAIMSVYKNDKKKEVSEAINSLINQTHPVDIFIQLDGIIDKDVFSYLKGLKFENKIKYLGLRRVNKGLAYSLNELLFVIRDRHSYNYVLRMDADDISDLKRAEYQFKKMEMSSEISVCGSCITEFNVDKKNKKQIVKYKEKDNEIKKEFCKRNAVAHVSTLIRLKDILEVNGYDESKKNEDYDLWIRMSKKGKKFYNIQRSLVMVRTSNDFYNRRKDFQRAIEVMKIKIEATKFFGCGIKGYGYAIAHFILFMSPGFVKKIIYGKLRK